MAPARLGPSARRNVALLGAFNFCNDFRVYAPIMVVYFAQVTGSFALGTLVFSTAKIAACIFEVPTGVFSDRIGRRHTLLLGQFASLASIASYAVADGFAVLAFGAVLEGLAFSLFSGNNEALLYDTLKAEGAEPHYSEWQGRVSALFQAALAVSAAVAMVALYLQYSLRTMFVMSLLPQIVGIVFALLLKEPARTAAIPTNIFAHIGAALDGFRRDKRLRRLAVASMANFALGEGKHMFQPAFFALFWPAWALGVAGVLIHGLGSLGFRLGGRAIRRFGEFRVLLGASSGAILAGLGAVAIPSVASPAIIALSSIVYGPAVVAQGTLQQHAFSDGQRATMASLIAFGGNLLFAVAVFAIGSLADRVGPRFALLAAEFLSIPILVLYWRLYRASRVEGRA